jgi:hypothetical protein
MTQPITLILELTRNQAAALKRYAHKISHTDAMSVLYTHVNACVRAEQVADIQSAFPRVENALAQSHVSTWPWIDTGCTSGGDSG